VKPDFAGTLQPDLPAAAAFTLSADYAVNRFRQRAVRD